MRAVIQRVKSASVTGTVSLQLNVQDRPFHTHTFHLEVDSELISSISRGLMVLVGIGKVDNIHCPFHSADKRIG